GDLVARGSRDVAIEDGDVVAVDAQQLQRGVAVAGDVGRDRLQAQPVANGLGHVRLVLDDQHTHPLLLCLAPGLDATSRRISSAYRQRHTRRQHGRALTDPMIRMAATRGRPRRTLRPSAVGLVVLTVAITGTLVYQSAWSPAPSSGGAFRG